MICRKLTDMKIFYVLKSIELDVDVQLSSQPQI